MNREYKKYVNKVLSFITTDDKTKKKIKIDLLEMLMTREEDGYSIDPYEVLGDPKEVADEFTDNLESSKLSYFEYKTQARFLGLPLIHITSKRNGKAVGIIAIGAQAYGVIALGGLSIGVISLGGICTGIFSLGGLSMGLYMAVGGIALASSIAVGGIAVAKGLAIGGIAVAKEIAVGSLTVGRLVAYQDEFREIANTSIQAFKIPDHKDAFMNTYEALYENISFIKDFLIRLFLG